MKKASTPRERAALAHPHDVDRGDEPDPPWIYLPAKDRSIILTSDMEVAAARRRVAKAQTLDHT